MLSFESDYTTGAHPEILKRLNETNFERLSGYCVDKYCKSAKEKIKKAVGLKNAQVELLVGGTQTNAVVISTMLHDYEGVIAVDSGHISVHEAGAIEYTGHKVLNIKGKNGKLDANDLKKYLEIFYADDSNEHMVYPGMVYISHPTEYGTLYNKKELKDIYKICKSYKIPLFVDGARLGYGLMSKESDMTIKEFAKLCDVFYIGGTKVGALCGEAVVFTNNNRPKNFVTLIKKRGALLAKGRLLGVQFDTLFTDDLYFKISRHAMDMAVQLKKIFKEKGFKFFIDSPTNQLFIIMDLKTIKKLQKKVAFRFWEKYDDRHNVVRFVTSWSTTEADINKLREII